MAESKFASKSEIEAEMTRIQGRVNVLKSNLKFNQIEIGGEGYEYLDDRTIEAELEELDDKLNELDDLL